MEISLLRHWGLCLRLLTVALIAAGSVRGQSLPLFSSLPEAALPRLDALLKTAVTQSPALLASNLDLALNQAQALGDGAQRRPQISANANYGYQDTISGGGSHNDNIGFYYNLGFNQALYHWGALKAQNEIGKIRVEIASHRMAEAYRGLALSVRSQYLTLVQKKRGVALSSASLKRAEAAVAALEQRFSAGAISLAELNEPKLRLSEQRLNHDRVLEDFNYSRKVLARTCGIPALSPEEIDDEIVKIQLKPEEVEKGLEIIKGFDVQNTEQGKLLAASVKQSDLDYFIASKRLYPKLGLSLATSQQNNTSVTGGTTSQATIRQQSAYLQVSWSLFDGYSAAASKRAALAQKRQAELGLKNYDQATNDQLESLRNQVLFASRAVDLAEIRLNIARASVAKVQEDVKLGHSSPDALEGVIEGANAVELSTYRNRVEFYAKLAEFLSLMGSDPAMLNLNPRVSSNGNP